MSFRAVICQIDWFISGPSVCSAKDPDLSWGRPTTKERWQRDRSLRVAAQGPWRRRVRRCSGDGWSVVGSVGCRGKIRCEHHQTSARVGPRTVMGPIKAAGRWECLGAGENRGPHPPASGRAGQRPGGQGGRPGRRHGRPGPRQAGRPPGRLGRLAPLTVRITQAADRRFGMPTIHTWSSLSSWGLGNVESHVQSWRLGGPIARRRGQRLVAIGALLEAPPLAV